MLLNFRGMINGGREFENPLWRSLEFRFAIKRTCASLFLLLFTLG